MLNDVGNEIQSEQNFRRISKFFAGCFFQFGVGVGVCVAIFNSCSIFLFYFNVLFSQLMLCWILYEIYFFSCLSLTRLVFLLEYSYVQYYSRYKKYSCTQALSNGLLVAKDTNTHTHTPCIQCTKAESNFIILDISFCRYNKGNYKKNTKCYSLYRCLWPRDPRIRTVFDLYQPTFSGFPKCFPKCCLSFHGRESIEQIFPYPFI